MKIDLSWWFVLCISTVALLICYSLGWVQYTFQKDLTHISIVTVVWYYFKTIHIGYLSSLANAGQQDYVKTKLGGCRNTADLMLGLGLLGTVSGLLIMLGNFANIDTSNLKQIQEMIGVAAKGMSTSGITTIVGLLCSFGLRQQIVNLEASMGLKDTNNSNED